VLVQKHDNPLDSPGISYFFFVFAKVSRIYHIGVHLEVLSYLCIVDINVEMTLQAFYCI